MKLRNLSIAMVVLAALLGALYWSNHRKAKEDTNIKASADAPPKILSLNQADVTGLRFERKDQPEVELSLNGPGNWQITTPKPLRADQDTVSNLLSTLSSLSSERLLDDKAPDVASYGLANPSLQVDVTLKDGKTQKLLVGGQTAVGNSYYAMLGGDPRLFTIAGYTKTNVDKSLTDLRDKRLFTADFDKVSQIELLNQKPDKKQDITFAREKDAWEIQKPKPYRADSYQVDDLIRALRDAKFEAAVDEQSPKLAASFKSASPLATVKVTGASGTQDLELRKDKDDYYAKSSALVGIYKVPASLATSLDKGLDDFRNKKLFDLTYEDPEKVELHDGSKSYFLTRSGSDWWGADGRKLDESSAEAIVNKIRQLSADKFPESGFSAPVMAITVTSNGGKRVEKVSLSKRGDTYFAKRENEPELYELAASTVSDLQQAAAALKPATPQAKK
jgi:Domain of unknown function (DUF4340)